ncbi:ABC transporter permease [Caldalkalibacillus mannanilyticus]|uniref:ABC transporter permease n=1 Tax=Caldalkalibacillus mannanilyticus TaxID=1418 RepID=UPI00046A0887|nr:ABC transporter permease [Caldalkalibacillus mannanilyticus]
MNNRLFSITVPLVSVVLGLFAGAIIMWVFGFDALGAYVSLFQGAFGDMYVLGETIRAITPLILTGLAVAFAFKTGLFNIGVEGQLIVGWLAAVYVGVTFDLPAVIHIPLAIVAAGVAGALWAFIPGFLKAKLHVHEVITTIMMNYIALNTANYIIREFLKSSSERTERIVPSASLQIGWLTDLFDKSRIHIGIFIALLGALALWFILTRTKLGFELRAVGFNSHASEYAGMNVKRNIILSMMISGVFAGIAGAVEGLGTYGYMPIRAGFTGIGFSGIAVALLGANAAIGIILAASLFGSLQVGALTMQGVSKVPTEIIDVVIALIIFFVASKYVVEWILSKRKKKEQREVT